MTFPRRAASKILPTRMRRKDAEDIAAEVIEAAKLCGRVVLKIGANREWQIMPAEEAIVGIYEEFESAEAIAAQVMARVETIDDEVEAISQALRFRT